jgi:hypothetical protein
MLGVGLHSYGFMDWARTSLLAFVMSQLLLIAAANLPLTWWRSYSIMKPIARPGRDSSVAVTPA